VTSASPKTTPKYNESKPMTQLTRKDTHSLDFAQMTSGPLKSAKRYTNTLMMKTITGTPYYMTVTTDDHTSDEEYLK